MARARAKHQEELGFLADVIPGPQETPEERVARYRAFTRAEYCQHRRDERAWEWRAVRQLLRSRPPDARAEIVRRWNASSFFKGPSELRHLIHEVSPPPEEVERRRTLLEAAIARIRTWPRYIEHVDCGPLRPWTLDGYWTCLGCGRVVRRGDPWAIEAAQSGALRYRFNGEGAVMQVDLLEGPV